MSIEKAKEVIRREAAAVMALEERIDSRFQKAVDIILKCKGRVIITGMGKSGIIAKKIVSTLTSTGTASLFLHPAEGVHGDLGVVLKADVIICISKSGNTAEILQLIPQFRKLNVPIIAMTGKIKSEMALCSDVVLDVSVKEEACPYDLVPTASTTATLVMGDALALALFQERGFSIEDFAQFHPGGDIGKRLILQVDDIMRKDDDIAKVDIDAPLTKTILQMTSKRLGATCVMEKGRLVGIITDGDLRRLIESSHEIWDLKAEDVMNTGPKCVESGSLAVKALQMMEQFSINVLIVIDKRKKLVGMVHIHDLLKAGVT